MKKNCIICGKVLKDGIMINGKGMCKACEKRLVNLKDKNDFYEYYKECIKKEIAHIISRGEDCDCQNYHL
ncbi:MULTISPECIES: sigma factor G inhibitor Gin [Clostridium]|uniref:sigma factor G inhibitor Gin n=1 Tax=Clostridium TaxID=1485 RepID=UPI00069F0427|nr:MULTISPECIES: sigma factor G inhibitor Gin [Clostridium]KOF57443.1 CsfB [Clostridium sp. DMHC 10]MCD2348371.1 sigma factor G inhibitor Gin [Clostridium guangxiense]